MKEANNDFEDHIYCVTAAIWTQKKNFKAKKMQLTFNVQKSAKRNLESFIIKPV